MIAFSDPTQAPGRFAVPTPIPGRDRNTEVRSDLDTRPRAAAPIPVEVPNHAVGATDAETRSGAEPSTNTEPSSHIEPSSNTDTIGDEIARLSAHLNAATYQLLVLIRTFDEREGWANGFLSCAHWLAWRTGISARPAREKVRVARALVPLDRISDAMASGTLSYSKVRALTRVAKPENEEDLLDVARHATAAQLERLVRAWRRVEDLNDLEKEEERHQNRFLRLHQDDDGSYRIQGRLDPEVGALLGKALEWANEALYQEDSETSFQHRMADGLGLVAERALAADTPPKKPVPVSRAERFQVVVHVEAEELRARISTGAEGGSAVQRESELMIPTPSPVAGGSAEPRGPKEESQEISRNLLGSAGPRKTKSGLEFPVISGGPGTLAFLPQETSRRLSCDAGLIVMTHDADGRVLDVGRRTRTVPPALRRALDVRDKGCRFPGCECRYADAHHIQHWAQGGETNLDNLILVCRRHHRALHEGGFQIRREPGGDDVEFVSSTGRVIPSVPENSPVQGDSAGKGDRAGQGDPGSEGDPAGHWDPVREIVARNADAGIVPDAWTATPLWNGEPLDISLAVEMFLAIGQGVSAEDVGDG